MSMHKSLMFVSCVSMLHCAPTIDGSTKVSGDTAGSTATDSGLDSGGPPDEPCGPTGVCTLTIEETSTTCGDGDPQAPSLTASVDSEGRVTATVSGADEGDSPSIRAEGSALISSARIDVGFALYDDEGNDTCVLDANIVFSGAPSGDYTLWVNGLQDTLTIP